MITLDIAAELRAALASPPQELLDRIAEAVASLMLSRQPAALEPLGAILGCSMAAARMRLGRDPTLRALGVPVGRRMLFRREEVVLYLKEHGRSRR